MFGLAAYIAKRLLVNCSYVAMTLANQNSEFHTATAALIYRGLSQHGKMVD